MTKKKESKKKSEKKQRAENYEEKVSIKGNFEDVIKASLKNLTKKK